MGICPQDWPDRAARPDTCTHGQLGWSYCIHALYVYKIVLKVYTTINYRIPILQAATPPPPSSKFFASLLRGQVTDAGPERKTSSGDLTLSAMGQSS